MNTGSNPVGVAAEKASESNTKTDDSGTDVQPLARRWPKVGEWVEVVVGDRWQRQRVTALEHEEVQGPCVVTSDGRASYANRFEDQGVTWRWPEEKAEGVSHSGGEGASVAAGATAAEAHRWPNVGEVVEVRVWSGKRRGAWVPATVDGMLESGGFSCVDGEGFRRERGPLCLPDAWRWPEASQEAKPKRQRRKREAPASEGKTTDPLALYGVTGGTTVEVFHGVKGQMWKRCEVVTVGSGGFTVALGTFYAWSERGKTWRPCIAQDATALDDVRCDDEEVDPAKVGELAAAMALDAGLGALRATHGKNGVPELPVVPSPAAEDARAELPALPGPRLCRGLPPFQGPDEVCDTILGREVVGDRCSVCAEWMRVHGECDGCNGRLPDWQVTGKLCADCRAVRQATIREQGERAGRLTEAMVKRFEDGDAAEQPNDRHKLASEILDACYEDFYAALWETLLADAELDRTTVEVCKRIRDDERLVRGGRR